VAAHGRASVEARTAITLDLSLRLRDKLSDQARDLDQSSTYYSAVTLATSLAEDMDKRAAAFVAELARPTPLIPQAVSSDEWVSPGAELASFSARLIALVIDVTFIGIFLDLVDEVFGASFVLAALLSLLCFPWMWSHWDGQSPGKRMMYIRVVRTNGGKPSFWRAITRFLGYYVSAVPYGLGFLWPLWDRRKQGFHDKIADTLVVRVQEGNGMTE